MSADDMAGISRDWLWPEVAQRSAVDHYGARVDVLTDRVRMLGTTEAPRDMIDGAKRDLRIMVRAWRSEMVDDPPRPTT